MSGEDSGLDAEGSIAFAYDKQILEGLPDVGTRVFCEEGMWGVHSKNVSGTDYLEECYWMRASDIDEPVAKDKLPEWLQERLKADGWPEPFIRQDYE